MATEAAWLNRGGLAKRDGDGKNHGKSKNSYRKKQNQFLTGIGLLMEGVGPCQPHPWSQLRFSYVRSTAMVSSSLNVAAARRGIRRAFGPLIP